MGREAYLVRAWVGRLAAAFAAVVTLHGAAAHAGGACTAPGAAGGGLQGAPGLVSSLVGGLLGAAAGLLAGVPAGASAIRCMPAEPASLDGGGVPRLAGNPVDVTTGAKLDRAIDLHLPAAVPPQRLRFGPQLELVFSRTYSSASAGAGPLGPGWRHAFETRLHAAEGPDGRRRLQVLQADGRLVRFGEPARGAGGMARHPALRREDGVLDALPPPAAPREAEAARAASPMETDAVRFVWHWRDGRQLRFADDGRLLAVVDGDDRLALHYEGTPARLAAVTDAAGRRLRLRYRGVAERASTQGPATKASLAAGGLRLAALETPDGRRVQYRHDARGRLVQVRHPGGESVHYRYADDAPEDGATPTGANAARLAAVVLPDGRESAYRYDSRGRVVHARAAGAPESEALQFRYLSDARGEPDGEPDGAVRREVRGDVVGGAGSEAGGLTRVSRGGFELAAYRWRFDGDGETRLLLEGRGPGCEACPPTGARYGYREGRLAEVEAGALRWRLAHDRHGRLVAVDPDATPGVDGGAPVPWLRIEWARDGLLDRPLRVRRPSVVAGREQVLEIVYRHDGRPVALNQRGYAPTVSQGRGLGRADGGVEIRRTLQANDHLRDEARGSTRAQRYASSGALQLPAAARPGSDGTWTLRAANGAVTRYWLDDFGRVVASDSPDSGLVRWRRDGEGRVLEEQVADGAVARHRYDAAGRLVEHAVSRAGEPAVSTRFRHAGGRLVAVEHPMQSERYAYDAVGRLAARTVRLRLASGRRASFETHYRYRADERAPQAWSLPDGSWLHLVRDGDGQVAAIDLEHRAPAGPGSVRTRLAGSLVGGPAGLRRAELGNGVRVSIERDPAGRPVRLCDRSPHAAAGRCDLLDHRLGFDARGRLLEWVRGDERSFQLYDGSGRLVQVLARGPAGEATWRRAYDANGNPLPAPGSARAGGAEARAPFAARADALRMRSNRVAADAPAAWDAAGRLLGDAHRRYRWNAMGLLAEVADANGRPLAAYRYDHRGARIGTQSAGRWRHLLFDAQRRPLAELDAHGRVLRTYVHLGDRPLAVLDAVPGAPTRIAWLHLDHRGAPVSASGAQGERLWQAAYAPFGRATRLGGAPGFDLPLRLPGQWEDVATGLHYNDHRWYDPDAGRYLSPDPLGLRGGPNPYAYAGNDPLTRIDPTGLLLFAFDGTGNSDPPPRLDDWSNVYKLSRAYADGRVWYMAGVGRNDTGSGIRAGTVDLVDARTARARVDYMLGELARVAASPESAGRWLDVDVIGFSRGAAMARDFANRVADRIEAGSWERLGACVRLRFLGLWDTVAQFGVGGVLDAAWDLAVPAQVGHAAHAVALNEHRTLFPAESIAGSPLGGVRVERGFIGAHSDVGGSYAEGDLSDVALGWMHAQALSAGVRMFALTSELARVTSPLLHDSDTDRVGDREFRQRNALGITVSSLPQRVAAVPGMQWRDTARFVTRFDAPRADAYGEPTLVGTVGLQAYAQWLASNYGFTVGWAP